MPDLDLDQNLLSAGADFKAGDWAHGEASATLDIRGQLALKRGIDLELGIGVMALLEAGLHKFLAADAQVRVEASAGLKGQVQLPLDVFGEAGIAVRLEAAARAAAMVRLGIGLSVRDFVELARQDSRIDGIALKLLIILLEEVKIQAGVSAKVAYSAMAYANLALTVRFVEDTARGLKPGFTVGGGYGVGLKAGYGYAMFAELGLIEPRRFIRRTVDALVDEVYAQLEPALPDPFARRTAGFMRYPAKMALRASFEIGMALAEASPTFTNQSAEIARQCVHVVLEEAQRALLEELAKLALRTFRAALSEAGVSAAAWTAAQPQRAAFANVLSRLPGEPFEIDAANVSYWGELVVAGTNLGLALAHDAVVQPKWREPLTVIWAAAHLAMLSVERISSAGVRASALGAVSASAHVEPFGGPLPSNMAPPAAIAAHLNEALGRPSGSTVRQQDLVEFLVRDVVLEQLVREVPESEQLLEIIAGPTGDGLVEAAKVILGNLGAFVPDSSGQVDAQRSLEVLATGLRAYIDVRLKQELAPLLYDATGDQPELRIYIDEVLIASLEFAVGTAFQKVLEWSSGGVGYRDALREACSSIVMKLFGRSLVVTSDVLMTYALEQMHGEIKHLSDHIDDEGGAAPTLATMLAADRALVADVLRETLEICADVLTPLPPARRAVIRSLLYDLIDTTPADPNAGWLDQLQQDFFIPDEANRQRMMQLADELGMQAAGYLTRFFERVIAKIGETFAAQIAAVVQEIAAIVSTWTAALQSLALELAARLLALPQQIDALLDEANARLADALHELKQLLDVLSSTSFRNAMRDGLSALLVSAGTALLGNVPGYAQLTTAQRNIVRNGLETAARAAVGAPVELVRSAIAFPGAMASALLAEMTEVLDELRAVEPSLDAGAEVAAILRRRVETATQAALGGALGLDVDFTVSWQIPQPAYWGVVEWEYLSHWPGKVAKTWGWIYPDPLKVDFRVALGRIELSPSAAVGAILTALATIPSLQTRADAVAAGLAHVFLAEDAARALEVEQAVAQAQQTLVQHAVNDANARDFDVVIASPLPASVHTQDIDIDIALEGVPASFLGRHETETPRVFIWLNQVALPLDEFDVEMTTSKGAAPASKMSRARGTDALRRASGPLDFASVTLHATRQATAGAMPMRTASTMPPMRAAGDMPVHMARDTAPGVFDAVLYDPHRRIDPSLKERARLRDSLRLAMRLPMNRCVAGANALTVAVVNGSGRTVQHTTVFLTAPESVREPTLRDPSATQRRPIRLPSPSRLDRAQLPLGLRGMEQDLRNDVRIPLAPADSTRAPRVRTGEPQPEETASLSLRAIEARAAALRTSASSIGNELRERIGRIEREGERHRARRAELGAVARETKPARMIESALRLRPFEPDRPENRG